MKHLFILEKNAPPETAELIKARAEDAGGSFELYPVGGFGEAAEKVKREALRGGELRVYACGDGLLLSGCAHGAAGYRNAAVTHFPCCGSADFIRTFGEDAARFSDLGALIAGAVRPVDLIDMNGRKCINVCSVGVAANIMDDAARYSALPLLGERGGRFLARELNLLRGSGRMLTIKDGEREISGCCSVVCALNGRFYAGGCPAPDASPDDGLLDFTVVGELPLFRARAVLRSYSGGDPGRYGSLMTHFTGRHLTVEAPETFPLNADGDVLRTKRAAIAVVPGGVNFIFPAGMECSGE